MTSETGDWVHIRSPFVYWAQTEDTVSLKVAVTNAQNPRIVIEEEKVVCDTTGLGAHGESEYHFELNFPHEINKNASTYRVLDREIDIILKKKEKGWWAKVITGPKKPAWLKVDFDRWHSPDDEDELPQDVFKDYPGLQEQLQRDEYGYKIENLRTVYLFLYNFFQFVGYLYVVGVLSIKFLREGYDVTSKAYLHVGFAMRYCQALAVLEVIHPLLGFVKTGVVMAFVQVFGRGLILFTLIRGEERVQTHPAVFYLFLVWSIAELIRYPFYMLQISGRKISLITWLRYTAWIVLYPLGISLECILLFNGIPHYVETGKFSVSLPNSWNFAFYYPALIRVYLLFGVFPISYSLLRGMWRARKRALKKGNIRKDHDD